MRSPKKPTSGRGIELRSTPTSSFARTLHHATSSFVRTLRLDTLGGAVEACRQLLRNSSDTPWLDACILAGFVTGLDASAIVAYGETKLKTRQQDHLFALATRLAAGEPVAYLVGFKEFCGLRITVDKRVLIPRPETEELVITVVEQWRGRTIELLDIGTGSGAIACALAHFLPRARVVAADVSEPALAVACHNVQRLGLTERIEIVRSDLFDNLAGRRFDVIVANLPYVGSDARHTKALALGVQAHEPAEAIFSGGDGLDVYRRMLTAAPGYVREGSALYCECSPLNARELGFAAAAAFPEAQIDIVMDAAGLERIIAVRVSSEAPPAR